MKVGLELEYWVIDGEGKPDSAQKISEKLEFAEKEFVKPLLEIKTRPHEDVDRLEKEVKNKLSEIIQTAEKLGLYIVPLGTPLNSGHIEKVNSRRGQIQEEIIGKNLDAAKRVAGTHIHFEKENVKDQLNILTALDPAMALLNSSPYYQGEKLGSSSRNQAYRYRCYQEFPGHGQLWNYIDSVSEWEDRIEKQFEEFKQAGKEKGIEEKEIETHFSAENALWTPVRLRYDFPTVEWRAPDTAEPDQVIQLLREVKNIVEKASEDQLPEHGRLEELSQKAIEKGLESKEVRGYLEDLDFSINRYTDISSKWRNGDTVSQKEACEMRLEAAESLHKSFK